MANQLPAKLKTPDIQRFALRASQLETAKPAIAYWCEYWIVQHVLAAGLHNIDSECLQYTTMLMDKLEQTKARHSMDDAIVDDTAGQAYVEQFGLETFERADRAVKANKVTKQTADTFLAASTFLELLNIWGEPDPDIHAKIRYAKWNAVRIAKALKEGKDPNESNPRPEPAREEDLQPLDPNDPEVRQLGGQPSGPRHASVEEVPDEQDRIEARPAAQSLLDHSLHAPAQPSTRASLGIQEKFEPYPRSGFQYDPEADHDVSPLEPPEPPPELREVSADERNNRMRGSYFPEVHTFTSETRPSTFQTAHSNNVTGDISPPDLHNPAPQPGPSASGNYDSYRAPDAQDELSRQPQNFYRPMQPSQPQQHVPRQNPIPAHRPPPPLPAIPPFAQSSSVKTQNFVLDDVAIAKAQKHARFAISALTFDDPNTAVKELRAALQTLGAE